MAKFNDQLTRFCLRQNGVLHELFHLRVMRDGTILIVVQPEDHLGGLADKLLGPVIHQGKGRADEVRFSVHPSIGRDGLTIKHQVRNAGKNITTKLLLDCDVHTIMSLIFSKICPVMIEKSRLKCQEETNIVELGSIIDNDNATFIYSLVITPKGKILKNPDGGFTQIFFEIGYFRIYIYSTYMNMPATHNGLLVQTTTFSPQVNNISIGKINHGKTKICIEETLEQKILSQIEMGSAHLIKNLVIENSKLSFLQHLPLYFHPNTSDLALARLQRGH